jgi:hypothetical protein
MRKRYAPIVLTLVALAALTSFVACRGGGGGSTSSDTPSATDTSRTTCKPSEPASPTTPSAVPQGLTEYRSPERGYRVQYPDTWAVKANAVSVANITGDAFFTGDTAGNINPNVSVTCETVPIGTSSGDFIDAKRTVVQKTIGRLPDIEGMLTVNGNEAASVAYSQQVAQTPEPIAMERVEVYFADDMGGWTIALTAPQGSIDTYRPAFDALVQSYRRP